jgi:hypothetical protein
VQNGQDPFPPYANNSFQPEPTIVVLGPVTNLGNEPRQTSGRGVYRRHYYFYFLASSSQDTRITYFCFLGGWHREGITMYSTLPEYQAQKDSLCFSGRWRSTLARGGEMTERADIIFFLCCCLELELVLLLLFRKATTSPLGKSLSNEVHAFLPLSLDRS